MRFAVKRAAAGDLVLGFKGNSCSFEFREYADRSPEQQAAYNRLRDDLLANGMRDPLITYRNHVLIGMRRFEILRDHREEFECVEILEDVPNWTTADIDRLQAFKRALYGQVAIEKFQA